MTSLSTNRSSLRLKHASNSTSNMTMNVMNLKVPSLPSNALSEIEEEEQEMQARISLSYFGFGASNKALCWIMLQDFSTPLSQMPQYKGSIMDNTFSTSIAGNVSVFERISPIGKNPLLYKILTSGDTMESSLNTNIEHENDLLQENITGLPIEKSNMNEALEHTYAVNMPEESSKLLQQYYIKATTFLDATLEEAIDFFMPMDNEAREDNDSLGNIFTYVFGGKMMEYGYIYKHKTKGMHHARHKKLKQKHSHQSREPGGTDNSRNMESSDRMSGVSEDSDKENVSNLTGFTHHHELHLGRNQNRSSVRKRLRTLWKHNSINTTHSVSDTSSTDSRVTEYSLDQFSRSSSQNDTFSEASYRSHTNPSIASTDESKHENVLPQNNMSLKWVVCEKKGRTTGKSKSKSGYCLLDYITQMECDWEEAGGMFTGKNRTNSNKIYVRLLESTYIKQCQPWLEEMNQRPSHMLPTGVMIRQVDSTGHNGRIEVSYITGILELMDIPNAPKRAKLRAQAQKWGQIGTIIRNCRLGFSLTHSAPQWVDNFERLECALCRLRFRTTLRRHHCRACGEVCCRDCCPKIAVPTIGVTSIRVCLTCQWNQNASKQKSKQTGNRESLEWLKPTESRGLSIYSSRSQGTPQRRMNSPVHHTASHYRVGSRSTMARTPSPKSGSSQRPSRLQMLMDNELSRNRLHSSEENKAFHSSPGVLPSHLQPPTLRSHNSLTQQDSGMDDRRKVTATNFSMSLRN